MNRISIALFIILLFITLFSGCGLLSDVDQLKEEMPAIRNDLNALETNLDNKVRDANAAIGENNRRIKKGISSINEELDKIETAFNDKAKKLNTDIQKNENEIKSSRNELEDLKLGLDDKVQQLSNEVYTKNNQNESEIQAISNDVSEKINGLRSSYDQKFEELNVSIQADVRRQKPLWIIPIIVLFLIITISFFFLRYKVVQLDNALSSKFTTSVGKLESEIIQVDTKLVQVLEGQIESDNLQLSQKAEPDHSLPIKVCEEIQRMRNRIKHMDQDDQATKVISKRLESLEEKLNDMGYEISELEGKPFIEGMTINAQFIADENLKDGERIISRVIKPQLMYKNKLIQAGDVEVRQGV